MKWLLAGITGAVDFPQAGQNFMCSSKGFPHRVQNIVGSFE
jgi:hypothetical protein